MFKEDKQLSKKTDFGRKCKKRQSDHLFFNGTNVYDDFYIKYKNSR